MKYTKLKNAKLQPTSSEFLYQYCLQTCVIFISSWLLSYEINEYNCNGYTTVTWWFSIKDVSCEYELYIKLGSFWLIMSMVWDLLLRTAATNGPIVHPPGDMWAWRAVVMMMPAGENSWHFHQSSLAILWAESSWEQVGGMDEGVRTLPIQYLRYLKGSLTCHKFLRHGASGFTSHSKEGVP
jgi:hypothetical protein